MASVLRWLQVTTVVTNLLIALLGLAVVAIGAITLSNQTEYFSITDNRTELYRIPYSLILVGISVVCMAVLGIVGAVATSTIGGRLLLGVYSFVLALVIFSELAAGGSALRAQSTFLETYVSSSMESIKNYANTSTEWDEFQEKYRCCGAENYTSYEHYGYIVPVSCCKEPQSTECEAARHNPNDTLDQVLYLEGCPKTVLSNLQTNFIIVGVVMIGFGVAQYIGVVMGCVLASVSSREEKRQVSPYSYNKLATVST